MLKKILVPFLLISTFIITAFLLLENMEESFGSYLKSVMATPMSFAGASASLLIADVLLPVPSSVIMYTNGFVLGILPGTILSLVSLMLGSLIAYFIGKYTSKGLKMQSDKRTNAILSRYGAISIIVTRGIPILSESISIVCGYNRLPLNRYLMFHLIGYLPVCLLYSIFGSIGYDQNVFLISFLASLGMSAILWWAGRSLITFQFKEGQSYE